MSLPTPFFSEDLLVPLTETRSSRSSPRDRLGIGDLPVSSAHRKPLCAGSIGQTPKKLAVGQMAAACRAEPLGSVLRKSCWPKNTHPQARPWHDLCT